MFKDLHGTMVYKGVHFYDFGCDDSVMYPLDFTFFSCNQDVYHLDSLALIVQMALYYFKSMRSIYEHDLGVFVANPCFSNVPNTCHIIDDNFFSILGFFSSEVFLLVASCVLLIFCVFQVKKNVFRLIFWLSVFFLMSTLVMLFSKSVVFSLCYSYQFFFSSFHLWFKIFFLVLMLIYLMISYFYFLDEKSGRPYFFVTYFFFLLFSFMFCMCADFIVFYVGLEGLSFVLYFILGQAGYRQRPMEALFKYFFLSGFSSNIMLFGMLLIYLSFGSVNFFDLYWLLVNLHSTDAFSFSYYMGFLVLFVGFFFKLGIVPFHVWMSDVYEGLGNHVTLFLATINKLVMVFAVLYLVYFFSSVFVLFQDIFLIFGFLTVGLGIICAYYETNISKIIAYSSIVTLGFLFMLYGLFMYYGLFLFVIYFLFYVLVVFTFFVVLIGMRERSKGFVLSNIWEVSWMYRLNPLLGYIFLVILFAFIGIPPLGLFFFKYLMFLAVTMVKMFSVLLILLFSTVLSVVYYISMARNIVFTFSEGLGEYISLRFFYVYFIIVGVYLVFFFVLFEYRVLLGLELFFADFWLLLPIVETELDLYVDKMAMLDVMIEKLEKLQDQALFSSRDVLEFKGLFDELFGEAEMLRWSEMCEHESLVFAKDFVWSSIMYEWLVILSDPKVSDPYYLDHFCTKMIVKY